MKTAQITQPVFGTHISQVDGKQVLSIFVFYYIPGYTYIKKLNINMNKDAYYRN
jgi:hypothetical protein